MPGTMSIDGIISGLNTQDIIDKLTDIRKKAIEQVQDRQADLTTKLTAWQDLNTRMLALKLKADALANPNTFSAKTVTSADEDIVTATAGSDAVTGIYYVKVKQMATAHQLQSQGYDDMSTSLGTGDITISVGGKETTINIDENNSSLLGVKDAINRADAGVKAAIVDTGQTSGRYKLVLTSNSTGVDNAITVTIPDAAAGGLQGGTAPTFTDLQVAKNAELELGSGANAIQISKSTNTITGVIPGVTLNIKSEDPTRVLAIDVQQDTESIRKAVDDFVDQYNNVVDFINEQFQYDQQTQQSGVLFGDFSLQTLQMTLASAVSDPVGELSQTLKALSQVGILADAHGKLSVGDDFETALSNSPNQVKALFSAVGGTADPNITFISATSDTKASAAGYAVEITRLATKTRVTAGVAQTANLAADETLTINGRTITLEAGWSPQQVVDEINARASELGVTASRTGADGQGSGDYLTITSVSYGSAVNLAIKSSVSNGGAAPVADSSGFGLTEVKANTAAGESGTGTGALGYDVLGKINGRAAAGSGQILTAIDGDADGLKLMVTGGAIGNRGVVTYTRGIGAILSNYITNATDKYGTITSAEDTLNRQISDAKAEADDLNQRLQSKQDQLYQQFAAMESALEKLRSQGSYITGLTSSLVNK